MRADMPLEIEGIVKTLATEITQMPFLFTVAFKMSVEHALILKHFLANTTRVVSTLYRC